MMKMKTSLSLIAVSVAICFGQPILAIPAAAAPKANIAIHSNLMQLAHCKIQLPSGSGNHADEVDMSEHPDFGTPLNPSRYFRQTSEYLEFDATATGATTRTSEHTRSELLDLRRFPYTAVSDHTVNVRVMQLAPGESVIVQQVHDDKEAIFMLTAYAQADGTLTIKAFVRAEDGGAVSSFVMARGVKLGDAFSNRALYNGGKSLDVAFTVSGETTEHNFALDRRGEGGLLYRKAGSYFTKFVDAGDHAVVRQW